MQNKQGQFVRLNDSDEEGHVVLLTDKATLTTRRLRDSGEMIAECTIARTGIMLYKAKELGKVAAHLPPEQMCRVRTKPEVLFDEATIEGCRSIPVTIGHPKDDVNIHNNKQLQKGFIEGRPKPDGSHLAASIVLNDEAAIRLVDGGTDQISLGHDALLVPSTDDGADFDKVTIKPNHAAIVIRGRAQTTRIGDSGEEIDIVDKTQFDSLAAERDELKDVNSKLEAQLVEAKANRLSDEDVEARINEAVKERVSLISQVIPLHDSFNSGVFDGMTELEIKRHVVSVLRDCDVSDKSDSYIEGRFEIALEDSGEVTLSDALSTSLKSQQHQGDVKKPSKRDEALARREQRYSK